MYVWIMKTPAIHLECGFWIHPNRHNYNNNSSFCKSISNYDTVQPELSIALSFAAAITIWSLISSTPFLSIILLPVLPKLPAKTVSGLDDISSVFLDPVLGFSWLAAPSDILPSRSTASRLLDPKVICPLFAWFPPSWLELVLRERDSLGEGDKADTVLSCCCCLLLSNLPRTVTWFWMATVNGLYPRLHYKQKHLIYKMLIK